MKGNLRTGVIVVSAALAQLLISFYLMAYYDVVIKSAPRIYSASKDFPAKLTVIVLGAGVHPDGVLSTALEERLDAALALYHAGKAKKFLLTGDHGRAAYDEVNTMKDYLEGNKVPGKDIFLDHAGFSTYDSMVRAKKVFCVNEAVIVTQAFHLPRSLYIAEAAGIDAAGCKADKYTYDKTLFEIREQFAVVKAFLYVNFNAKPKFLGEMIPVTGDSRLSWDEKGRKNEKKRN